MIDGEIEELEIDGAVEEASCDYIGLWAWCVQRPDEPVRVSISLAGVVVGEYIAQEFRTDLISAGKGNGRHGLRVSISHFLERFDTSKPIDVEVDVIYPSVRRLGPARTITRDELGFSSDVTDLLSTHFLPHFIEDYSLWKVVRRTKSFANRPPSKTISTLTSIGHDFSVAGNRLQRIPNLSEYTLHLAALYKSAHADLRSITSFTSVWEIGSLLKDLLQRKHGGENEGRPLLSESEWRFLNEPVFIGHRYSLTRASWMFLSEDRDTMSRYDLNTIDGYTSVLYKWCVDVVGRLNLPRQLITRTSRDYLSSVSLRWSSASYPLSRFMELYFAEHAELHFLNLQLTDHRAIFLTGLLLRSSQIPLIIDLLPPGAVNAVLRKIGDELSVYDSILQRAFNDIGFRYDASNAEEFRDELLGHDEGAQAGTSSQEVVPYYRQPVASDPLALNQIQLIGPTKNNVLGSLCKSIGLGMANAGISCDFIGCDIDQSLRAGPTEYRRLLACPSHKIVITVGEIVFIPELMANFGFATGALLTVAAVTGDLSSLNDEQLRLPLALLDEVWVTSKVAYQRLKSLGCRRLRHLPATPSLLKTDVVRAASGTLIPRLTTRLPITFLSSFHINHLQRNDPFSVIQAFTRAFEGRNDVKLVLLTYGSEPVSPAARQEKAFCRLLDDVSDDSRIHLVFDESSVQSRTSFLEVCDAYVSLHRADGIIQDILDAAWLGKIVVVSDDPSYERELIAAQATVVSAQMIFAETVETEKVRFGQTWLQPSIESAIVLMRDAAVDSRKGSEGKKLKAIRDALARLSNDLERSISEFLAELLT